ncbi:MAG: pyruvate ferredoxin oxidoreductase [Candidatus Latescibacterota bacterium]|nr:MAG: pyruvate ferredoxin oxidoreductase [Candidatus Latescibacterota bacterium]HDI00579.1 pyruvate ferredoxin oxidoreductase [Bacillota bacterium]
MAERMALTGNEAVAYAMMQINPDVVAAYPITPQTALMQKFADFVADGEVDTQFVLVESEHSAMSAVVGAAAAGARAMTATAANGLALMWEILYIAASTRLPIVMPVVNRALSAPINILCDHSDTMGARDSGWIQLFSENAQEAYDNTIQAVRIAEHRDVLTPVMVTLDGFIISHGLEVVEVLDKEAVQDFVGEYEPAYTLLDPEHPITFGPIDFSDYYMEHKRSQVDGIEAARRVIPEVGREFGKRFGRSYGMIEEHGTDGAEALLVALGSTAGSAKAVVDDMRERGLPVGLVKIRAFRPFPYEELREALGKAKAVAVMDRSISFGAQAGPLALEVRSALYGLSLPVRDYIYGLGGRNITLEEIEDILQEALEMAKTKEAEPLVKYVSVRE